MDEVFRMSLTSRIVLTIMSFLGLLIFIFSIYLWKDVYKEQKKEFIQKREDSIKSEINNKILEDLNKEIDLNNKVYDSLNKNNLL